ncbi:MAG: CoB--CoM heterodisulfide reductase iron-sulfur subunit A family protein [Deltaproteobacteria bacterium]|nr:CoB--CoM heterodisulfide reductase iron-sulfur subunit A family protein [Deltaproteobacteria bacterium]
MSLRIGVFICHCGTNIGGTVHVPDVVEYAGSLPHVAHAEGNLYTCSEDGLSSIREQIAAHDLNRVVVASCTPRTHEPLFKKNCEMAGLNKYLFEFVNLREHCSWVHMGQQDKATEKAKDLVRMGVAKVALLTPESDLSTDVLPTALVVGGGITGLSAALSLGNQGYRVDLLEKTDQLGGILKGVNRVFPSNIPTSEFMGPLIDKVLAHDKIHVHFKAELTGVNGFIGNFSISITEGGKTAELNAGTIIIAVGARELAPKGLFQYGELDPVMTQLEFEKMTEGPYDRFKDVVMINCVGARTDSSPYCSRFCCITAIKNATLIKEAVPDANVTILQRDIMAVGKVFEIYYQKAMQVGVRFVRYNRNRPPEIIGTDGRVTGVKVYHELMGREIELPAEAVILTTPLVHPEDNQVLSRMMKIPLGNEGFFMEAHQKLRPVEFPADGIFIAGCARFPADITDCVSQGYAAAAKAAVPMARRHVVTDALISEVDPLKCSGCGRCIDICPFGAIDWAAGDGSQDSKPRVARVNSTECKGCGLCAASCLSGAVGLKGFTDAEILAMVDQSEEGHQLAL